MLIEGLDSTIQSLGIMHNVLFYAGVYPVENIYLPVDQMIDRARFAERQAATCSASIPMIRKCASRCCTSR